jgi:hypothetical protein
MISNVAILPKPTLIPAKNLISMYLDTPCQYILYTTYNKEIHLYCTMF